MARNRQPVSRAAVRKAQRARAKKAARIKEYGKVGGAPPKWTPRDVERICMQVRDHLVGFHDYTDDEIADFYGMSVRTFSRYKHQYPELARACLRGEAQLTRMVERKLVQTAVGYRKQAIKIMHHQGEPMAVHYEEHIEPNVSAQVAFLKAKKPKEYRERLDLGSDPDNPVTFRIDGLYVNQPEKAEKENQ